jgi:hypothetical protein
MQPPPQNFTSNARAALKDPTLQRALQNIKLGFRRHRQAAGI